MKWFVSVILGIEEVKILQSCVIEYNIVGSNPLIFDVFAKFRAVCESWLSLISCTILDIDLSLCQSVFLHFMFYMSTWVVNKRIYKEIPEDVEIPRYDLLSLFFTHDPYRLYLDYLRHRLRALFGAVTVTLTLWPLNSSSWNDESAKNWKKWHPFCILVTLCCTHAFCFCIQLLWDFSPEPHPPYSESSRKLNVEYANVLCPGLPGRSTSWSYHQRQFLYPPVSACCHTRRHMDGWSDKSWEVTKYLVVANAAAAAADDDDDDAV